ncbi:MAG: exodeoxyribonuclease III [Actinobacteria bacterium]|nr:exodeoxyribonuclease III [Actinomycetota bacterium]
MRVATFNANGIRAAMRRGFGEWLLTRDCDVVAIQELRCAPAHVPEIGGYHVTYEPGLLPGRNGVAILSRAAPLAVRTGLGRRAFESEGRYVEVDLDLDGWRLTVGSLYVPKGGRTGDDPRRYAHKLRFMRSLRPFLVETRRRAVAQGREYLVMGDINVAHTRLDVRNATANGRQVGFLPSEREWFTSLLGPRTLVDVVRRVHPGEQGPYSWWLWGPGPFDNDVGWRIDYHLATPGLARAAVRAGTDRARDYASRMSDHAPVVVDYASPPTRSPMQPT